MYNKKIYEKMQQRSPKKEGRFGVRTGFVSKKTEKEGDIVSKIHEPIYAFATTSIKNVANLMIEKDCRRIPIVDAGTKRLVGMAKAIDIIDFFGGGEKYNIILKAFNGNLLSAINSPISKIMCQEFSTVREKDKDGSTISKTVQEFSTLTKQDSINDAINIIVEKHHSLIPIVDMENKILGVVSERDFLPDENDDTNETIANIKVEDVMNTNVITATVGTKIKDIERLIVRNKYRRIPIVSNNELYGIVTVMDVLNFFKSANFMSIDSEEILSQKVDSIATKAPITVTKQESIKDVVKIIKETGIGGFPVVEEKKSKTLIGILTITDILKKIYKE